MNCEIKSTITFAHHVQTTHSTPYIVNNIIIVRKIHKLRITETNKYIKP